MSSSIANQVKTNTCFSFNETLFIIRTTYVPLFKLIHVYNNNYNNDCLSDTPIRYFHACILFWTKLCEHTLNLSPDCLNYNCFIDRFFLPFLVQHIESNERSRDVWFLFSSPREVFCDRCAFSYMFFPHAYCCSLGVRCIYLLRLHYSSY